jgi:hypothetical protein
VITAASIAALFTVAVGVAVCRPWERREMPALDRLQAKLGGADFVVLPLSIDRGGLPPVKRFYAELGLKALGIFVAGFVTTT